jgi:undecaprenyl-diphosphatase
VDLHKPHPPSLSPRALAIAGWSAFAVAGLLFLAIAWNVTGSGSLATLDAELADWLHAHARPWLVGFFLAVTHLHSTIAIVAFSIAFAALLARLREWYWMLTLGAAVGGVLLVNVLLKYAYERLRPRFDDPLVELATYSFPSGHTAGAVAFYGVLAAFLVSRYYDARRRAACVSLAIAAVALVAFSRLYLGAHYLSDVVAAACSSTAWLVLCLAGGHALVRGRLRPKWVAIALLALAAVFIAVLLPVENWSARLQQAMAEMDGAAALLFFVTVAVLATLLLIPAWIFPLIAGAVFGFSWGLVAAFAATLAAALAAFLVARYLIRAHVERAARRHRAFNAVEAAVAKEPRKVVALLRMSPVLPSGLKSYFLGLTKVRLADYTLASAAGVLPGVALKVYVGAAGRGALAEGSVLDWTIFALGVAATIALTLIVGRKVKKKLKLEK